MKSHYQTLGLPSPQATPEQIEAAYRRLAAEFPNNCDFQKAIAEAHAALIDPQHRAAYDRQLQASQAAEAEQAGRAQTASGGGWRWLGLASLALVAVGYYQTSQPKPAQPAALAVRQDSDTLAPPAAMAAEEAPAMQQAVAVPAPAAMAPEPVVRQTRETQVRFVRPDRKAGFDPAYLAWTTYLVVGGRSRGSGVMVAPDRILTNCHVVAGNAMSGLIVINSATHERAKVDKYAKLEDDEDICVLSAPGAPAYIAEWGRSESLDPGAPTHTVSFPGNEGLTWSSGTLIRREIPLGMEVLVTSNYCRPGVSGGPLFDDKGQLIGITSAGRVFRGGGGECMSLTAETAKKVLYKPMVPIGLAPTQYDPAMLRR
jgi:S1-C subfamily serine protease